MSGFKKKPEVQKENSDRYIITYADLLTLLLAFFIILFAMSEPDQKKIEQLGDYFQSTFKPRVKEVELIDRSANTVRNYNRALTQGENEMMKSISEQNRLRKIKSGIDEKIRVEGMQEDIQTELYEEGLKVTITNEILFDSGSDKVKNKKGRDIIVFIGGIIGDFNNAVSIAGHTDNVPINNSKFKNNWELSSARSLSVLKEILSGNPELTPVRFSASGYGEYRPIENNNTASGREKNRRVEILIERSETNGLLTVEGDN